MVLLLLLLLFIVVLMAVGYWLLLNGVVCHCSLLFNGWCVFFNGWCLYNGCLMFNGI